MTYSIENDFLKISIKEKGAELSSIYYKPGNCELMWQGDESIWNGQAPILFPIVGRLWQDKYRTEGKVYTLPKHGFARKSIFTVTKQEKDEIILTLKSDEAIKETYPYEFCLNIIYKLDNDSLNVCYEVCNTDNKTIYYSIGGHPGFQCEMGDKIVFEYPERLITELIDTDGYLKPDKEVVSENGIISITPDSFIKDALIFSNMKSKCAILKKQSGTPDIKMTFNDAEFLGIWAKPGAPYVCIEPWIGINDCRGEDGELAGKRGVTKLSKGENSKFSFDIKIMPK